MGKRKKASDTAQDATTHTTNKSETQSSASAANSQQSSGHALTTQASAKANESSSAARWSSGSWRGKANAVAEMTRESISSVSSAAQAVPYISETVQSKDRAVSTSERLSRTLRTPSKSGPIAASMTPLSVTSNSREQREGSGTTKETKGIEQDEQDKRTDSDGKNETKETDGAKEQDSKDRPLPAAGWRGWWSRPPNDGEGEKADAVAQIKPSQQIGEPQQNTTEASAHSATNSSKVEASKTLEIETQPSQAAVQPPKSSWFSLWGSGQSAASGENVTSPKSAPVEPAQTDPEPVQSTNVKDVKDEAAAESNVPDTHPPSSGSWAFWSREAPKKDSSATAKQNSEAAPEEETGELAIARTPSQAKPKPAQIKEPPPQSGTSTPKSSKIDKTISGEAVKEKLEDKSPPDKSHKLPSKDTQVVHKDGDLSETLDKTPKDAPEKSAKRPKSMQRNSLLPEFQNTYHLAETPSYWQQLIRMFGRGAQPDERHLSIAVTPPKIQKAIAIGVHGYFPAPLVQRVIGQPTGTSLRFANGAATAIQSWAEKHGQDCEVQKVALEGEGMISDRVDTLWKLLLNWIDQIRKADFIMIACHSQGVPVAIMLLARLIDFGCISSSAKLGVCGMAGVNLGPFSQYQSRFFGTSSAGELFDFSRSNSAVQQKYQAALSTALSHHVRIVYVGSIDDQLVSLESSTFSNISHPYIYRAVFVDGRIHAPDFLSRLVGFALKLRNLGISDHGLIRELSSPLAGSLYTGEGHSRIYEDSAVYDLAVQHALETTTLTADMPLEVKPYEVPATNNTNPYFLPWAMRGLLEEEFVKTELKDETGELLHLFEGWQPSSKVLKDVKFRLEAVKSKL